MEVSTQRKNLHLLWRAGFGPAAADLATLATTDTADLRASLWNGSAGSVTYLNTVDSSFQGLFSGMAEAGAMQKREFSPEEKKQFRKQSQLDIKNLNLAWLNEMTHSDAQLREKMALFWHGHFASRNLNIYYQQQLLDVIRRGALGNFGDLLRNVSKSAAMLNFLNNNQNRKGHPNENFSREVMELFTMGRGNYSEEDVKEAARAFTGWGATFSGEFVFRRGQHDEGSKTVLGQNGRMDGDDILHLLLDQKQTALFVTRKIYRYFVNEEVDEARITWLADRWYARHYEIKPLLEDIFSSEWFYDPQNMGCRIKSPVDLLVGIRRLLPMQIENESVQLLVQRLLGQVLFYPPNVAGWPGGRAWIDSSTLMFRLRIPELIVQSDAIRLHPKDDDDQMMGMREEGGMATATEAGAGAGANNSINPDRRKPGRGRKEDAMSFHADIDWGVYLKKFDKLADSELAAGVSAVVLQTRGRIAKELLDKYAHMDNREERIRAITIRLMSTPEYQLC